MAEKKKILSLGQVAQKYQVINLISCVSQYAQCLGTVRTDIINLGLKGYFINQEREWRERNIYERGEKKGDIY